MTTLPEARTQIYVGFLDSWGVTTPVALDNETFDATTEPWVRLSVRHLPGGQQTLGSVGTRIYRRYGNAFVQVFTPSNSGTKQADDLAQLAKDILEGTRLDTVVFNDSQITEIPSDGKWYNILVEATFYYDEIK